MIFFSCNLPRFDRVPRAARAARSPGRAESIDAPRAPAMRICILISGRCSRAHSRGSRARIAFRSGHLTSFFVTPLIPTDSRPARKSSRHQCTIDTSREDAGDLVIEDHRFGTRPNERVSFSYDRRNVSRMCTTTEKKLSRGEHVRAVYLRMYDAQIRVK